MTLLDLIKSQKENKERYNFIIYLKDIDIINTISKITFNQLFSIIGSSLENKKIEYTVYRYVVMIEIKDS